jgi:hypothetical protein
MCLSTLWQRNHCNLIETTKKDAYPSVWIHTHCTKHIHCNTSSYRNTHAKRPRLHYVHHMHLHASLTDTRHATRNWNDNCGYFCSANRILAQTRVSFWWMAQRIVDYYEHVDSDWIQFYSANQIIGVLLQARGQCQAHLQRHSRHISHALHVYEVNHGRFLISFTL